LTQTNAQLRQNIDELNEKASQEQPVIVERIVETTPDEEVRKLTALVLTNNDGLLLSKQENDELKRQVQELLEMSRKTTQELESLKALRDSEETKPWVYVEPSAPATEPTVTTTAEPSAPPAEPSAPPVEPSAPPVEPSALPAEPSALPAEPSALPAEPTPTESPPPYTEKVINVEPKELLDNKSIVIRIVMPRGAQIISSSDTGNSAEEQIVKMIGGGSLNPATLHPASLF
jgi:hypothetical protein